MIARYRKLVSISFHQSLSTILPNVTKRNHNFNISQSGTRAVIALKLSKNAINKLSVVAFVTGQL